MTDGGTDTDVPEAVASVARRYRRLDVWLRRVLALLTLLVIVLLTAVWSLTPALLAGIALLLALRVPLLRTESTTRLRTSADLDAVRRDFAGPTPPMLALQWGSADEVDGADEAGATADGRWIVSYAFGLRSVEMRTAVEERPAADADDAFDVVVTVDGSEWATYAVDLHATDDGTLVHLAGGADRRFSLVRFLVWPRIDRAFREAVAAQGYEVVERAFGVQL